MIKPTHETSPAQEARIRQEEQPYKEEGEQSRQQTREAMDATRERVEQSARQAGDQAMDALDERKNHLAQSIDEIGDALDSAVAHLREKQHGQLADYGQRFVRGIHDASHAVQQRSPAQLWQDTSSFARRRPDVVLGGMFAAGLALSRFFKAAEPRTH
ncbi:MAG: hypothetical protein ACOCW2_04165 [Chitinivibrionales bacterium]